MKIERLVGRRLPIIDEAHGEWRTGQGVSERLREGQRGAALERLRHSGAIRRALRVIIVRDAICSSSDEGHDALMEVYHSRFSEQIETANADEILDAWS
jgi:nicotinamidase-related amidase